MLFLAYASGCQIMQLQNLLCPDATGFSICQCSVLPASALYCLPVLCIARYAAVMHRPAEKSVLTLRLSFPKSSAARAADAHSSGRDWRLSNGKAGCHNLIVQVILTPSKLRI